MNNGHRRMVMRRAGALLLLASLATAMLRCSSSSNSNSCADMAGHWAVSGGCGAIQCTVNQSSCSISIGCTLVDYTGSISGDSVGFQSFASDGGVVQSCQATLAGTVLSGSCTTSASSCSFTAMKQ
jgi:hypothetical protein